MLASALLNALVYVITYVVSSDSCAVSSIPLNRDDSARGGERVPIV